MIEESYYESAKGITISQERALKELELHHCDDFDGFFRDLGKRKTYNAQKVLQWLGY
jgi:hypothetical protein